MGAGQTIAGNSVSLTVTVKLQLAELPEMSVIEYDTVDVLRGKLEPGANPVRVGTMEPSQLSVAMGSVHVTLLKQFPGEVTTFMLAGHTRTGLSLSVMTTLNPHPLEFPAESETE